MSDFEYIPDCLFQTDNDLEIPTLRLDRQPSVCEIPFVCYGEQARTFKMNGHGTLHFYTDDYRYNTIYDKPSLIMQHDPANIVEPNFSCFNETPIAFGLQAIYKKRWLARTMQEHGINVFVDMNVAAKFYKLNMIGIPVGYRSYCTRGYSDRLQYLEFEWNLARQMAAENADNMLFVIYGGGANVREFAKQHRCIYVNPIIAIKNKVRSAQKKIEQSVAFVGEEFDTKKALEQWTDNLFSNQVESYVKSIAAAEGMKAIV